MDVDGVAETFGDEATLLAVLDHCRAHPSSAGMADMVARARTAYVPVHASPDRDRGSLVCRLRAVLSAA